MMTNTSIIILGLGKMGGQIARRLKASSFDVYGWDIIDTPINSLNETGIFSSKKIEDIIAKTIDSKRIFWLIAPHEVVDDLINNTLSNFLKEGDIVIDGGNSFYKDTVVRALKLKEKNIYFFDCGTSGGIHGEKNGFSLMVGGDKNIWPNIEPVIKALSAGDNYAYLGESGAGHFTKMVHNGIEYGMMESIAEGYAVLDAGPYKLNLVDVTRTYQTSSVVRSWLIDLCAEIFKEGKIGETKGIIDATGEGEWTVNTGHELGIDVRVIEDSYKVRKESQKTENQNKFSNKLIALLRNKFGGHNIYNK